MKQTLIVALALLVSLLGLSQVSYANTKLMSSNPSVEVIKKAITDVAIKHDIPPEILKAIAFEESGYTQFNPDGSPFISNDGGIGIMQITPDKVNLSTPIDTERLKTDYQYNIEIGAEVLDSKWNLTYLPKINSHNRHILEDWYFAIMAYNGASKVNDPNFYPGATYQDGVYQRMESSSLLNTNHFKFPTFDIRYNGSDAMVFPDGKDYTTTIKTPTQQMYSPGDIVYIDARDGAVNLHSALSGTDKIATLWPYTPLTVESGPYESNDVDNDFAYYKVKGINHEGYVATAYLNKGSKDIVFPDAGDDQRAAALAYMSLNGYAHGYANGLFGSNDSLKREHVAVILDNILHMTLPSGYQMKADDVSLDNPYYVQLEKAEANGYLGGGGKLRPNEFFTRSQMAQVMVEAFGGDYQKPTSTHIFKDQSIIWNPDEVNTIYFNNVTVSDPFHPNSSITRSQFAIFIYRTMVNYN